MSDYAIVNLLELDDSVAGRAEGMEGRFGRSALGAQDIGVSHWRYAANFRSPAAHSHREQEEAYVVVAGSGRALLDAPWPPVYPKQPNEPPRVAPSRAKAP